MIDLFGTKKLVEENRRLHDANLVLGATLSGLSEKTKRLESRIQEQGERIRGLEAWKSEMESAWNHNMQAVQDVTQSQEQLFHSLGTTLVQWSPSKPEAAFDNVEHYD